MHFLFYDSASTVATGSSTITVLAGAQVVWRSESSWAVKEASFRQHDALFRAFAEIEPTRAGVEAFARQFGSPWAAVERLGVDRDGRLKLFFPKKEDVKFPDDWRDQVEDLRQCVRLWDLVRAGDNSGLARYIRWQVDAARGLSVHFDSHPDLEPGKSPSPPDRRVTAVIASADADCELLESLKPGDVRAPALLHIEATVNRHLVGLVQPRLLCIPQKETVSLHMVPLTLIGGMWLQFAQAVAENKDYARCRECGGWFEVSLPGARRTRVYCSDGCKVKAYQGRKDRAVRLKAEGWKVKEIAEELGTSKDIVKRWLGKQK